MGIFQYLQARGYRQEADILLGIFEIHTLARLYIMSVPEHGTSAEVAQD